MKTPSILLLSLGLASPLLHGQAGISPYMNYQGSLAEAGGVPLGNTSPVNRKAIFRIYSAATGGTLLWSEEQTITISEGQFSVLLGNGASASYNGVAEPYPALATVFTGDTGSARHIELIVDDGNGTLDLGDTPIAPRQRLTSSSFSFRSTLADRASFADRMGNDINTGLIIDGSSKLSLTNGTANLEIIPGYLSGTSNLPNVASINITGTGAKLGFMDDIVMSGDLSIAGAMSFPGGSLAAPSNGATGGSGMRMLLWPGGTSSTPYGFGITTNAMYSVVPTTAEQRWYIGTQERMTLRNDGVLDLINGSTITQIRSGDKNGTPQAGAMTLNVIGTGTKIYLADDVEALSALKVNGSLQVTGTSTFSGGTTFSGNLSTPANLIAGGTLDVTGAGTIDGTLTLNNRLQVYNGGLLAPPANGTTGGSGMRMLLSGGGTSATPYGFGMDTSAMYSVVPSTAEHRWYSGTSQRMSLSAAGDMELADGTTTVQFRVGDLNGVAQANAFTINTLGAGKIGFYDPVSVNGTLTVSETLTVKGKEAVVGEEELRMVRGTITVDNVANTASVLQGTGFTVTRNSEGKYTINITSAFSATPSPTATPYSNSDIYSYIRVANADTNSFEVYTKNGAGVAADHSFSFIVIGPR